MSNLKVKNYDLTSLIIVISLIIIGLINIYSVSYSDSNSIENFFTKQLVFVLFSFSICFVLLLLDINFYFNSVEFDTGLEIYFSMPDNES